MNVTEIGGHFVQINPPGNGKIFGGIVEVPGTANGDFPSFSPATIGADALALTTLDLLGGDPPVSADTSTHYLASSSPWEIMRSSLAPGPVKQGLVALAAMVR